MGSKLYAQAWHFMIKDQTIFGPAMASRWGYRWGSRAEDTGTFAPHVCIPIQYPPKEAIRVCSHATDGWMARGWISSYIVVLGACCCHTERRFLELMLNLTNLPVYVEYT